MIVRELLVRLGVDYDQKGQKQAEGGIEKMRGMITKLGIAYAAQRTFGFLEGMVSSASRAEDKLNVLNKTFGSASQGVIDWATQQSTVMGRSAQDLQEYATGFGAVMASQLGSREEAAEMGKALAGLSVDLGSFHSMADTDVMERLRSGMLGSVEAVDQLAINLHQESLEAFAAEKGIKGFNAQSSETLKMQVRFQKIMADTADAHGWAADHLGEYDNQLKAMQGSLADLGRAVGKQLLGPATKIVTVLRSMAIGMQNLAEHSKLIQVALAALAATAAVFAAIWIVANLPLILMVVAIGALLVAVEDLYSGLEGGGSVIKEWFSSLAGRESWDAVVRSWQKAKKALGAIMSGDLGGAWEAVTTPIDEKERQQDAAKKQAQQDRLEGKNMTQADARLRDNPWFPWLSDAGATDAKGDPVNGGRIDDKIGNAWSAFSGYLSRPGWKMGMNEQARIPETPQLFGPSGPIINNPPPDINITVQGNANQDTVREMERVARRVIDDSNKNLLYTTSNRPVSPLGRR